MSTRIHASRFANSRSFLQLAFVALAGFFCSSMAAQTAPQLLPYSVKVIAGGGTTALPLTVAPGACTPSGNTPTTIWGDGCLATDLVLSSSSGPRSAVADASGNVFFADYYNGLIRRVDAATGIITTVAGGVAYGSSPGTNAVCATGASTTATDAKGDGCLGTQVFLIDPIGLVISPAGDLYFSEYSTSTSGETAFGADVRKIAATNGVITGTGVISMVDGALSSYTSEGYSANNYSATPPCSASNLANCIVAATSSYLYAPYSLAFDGSGNLYIAEENEQAILVVNTSANTNTVAGVTIPSGTVAKIVGYSTIAGDGSTCPNGYKGESGSPKYGCNYGTFTNLASANSSEIDNPYSVTVDPSGNIYFSNYFNYDVAEVSATGTSTTWTTSADIINNFAGEQGTGGANSASITTRAVAGSFAIGDPHGVAADSNGNIYITDSNTGVIWRVDAVTNNMYVVAGGASTVCTASIVPGVTTIDNYGDGCPATSAKFGVHTGATGIFGVSVDANSNLFVGDTLVPLVREVSSGTRFSPIADTPVTSANQATQYVEIHFAAGDGPISPASAAYTLTSGASEFSLGSAVCTTNSDTTQDCVLPITAAPTALGAFTGTLQVTATVGGSASFPLSGTFIQSPQTRTVVSASQAVSCTNTTAFSTATPVTLTAAITSSGPVSNSSTVTFYANDGTQNTQIGTPQDVNGNVATLTYTFTTAGNYAITAVFSGDSFYEASTSLAFNISSAVPSLGTAAVTSQLNTVSPGQTALYSFSLAQNVVSGTINFACSSLPAHSSCVFNPVSISASGCQTSSTITMSILTQGSTQAVQPSSLSGAGRGPWQALGISLSIGLALLIGVRRRRVSLRHGQIWMVLALLLAAMGIMSCNGMSLKTVPTPAGTYTVSVTATGSGGATSSFTVPLTVQ